MHTATDTATILAEFPITGDEPIRAIETPEGWEVRSGDDVMVLAGALALFDTPAAAIAAAMTAAGWADVVAAELA